MREWILNPADRITRRRQEAIRRLKLYPKKFSVMKRRSFRAMVLSAYAAPPVKCRGRRA